MAASRFMKPRILAPSPIQNNPSQLVTQADTGSKAFLASPSLKEMSTDVQFLTKKNSQPLEFENFNSSVNLRPDSRGVKAGMMNSQRILPAATIGARSKRMLPLCLTSNPSENLLDLYNIMPSKTLNQNTSMESLDMYASKVGLKTNLKNS